MADQQEAQALNEAREAAAQARVEEAAERAGEEAVEREVPETVRAGGPDVIELLGRAYGLSDREIELLRLAIERERTGISKVTSMLEAMGKLGVKDPALVVALAPLIRSVAGAGDDWVRDIIRLRLALQALRDNDVAMVAVAERLRSLEERLARLEARPPTDERVLQKLEELSKGLQELRGRVEALEAYVAELTAKEGEGEKGGEGKGGKSALQELTEAVEGIQRLRDALQKLGFRVLSPGEEIRQVDATSIELKRLEIQRLEAEAKKALYEAMGKAVSELIRDPRRLGELVKALVDVFSGGEAQAPQQPQPAPAPAPAAQGPAGLEEPLPELPSLDDYLAGGGGGEGPKVAGGQPGGGKRGEGPEAPREAGGGAEKARGKGGGRAKGGGKGGAAR